MLVHKIISKICSWIVTLGPIGYLPCSGTFGTLAAFPLLLLFRRALVNVGFFDERIAYVLLFVVFVSIVNRALNVIPGHDPSCVIIDEVLGFFITMIDMPLNNPIIVIMGIILFRFFDIVKPLGIDRVERINGGWGIMLDDVIAGVFAHIFLYMFCSFFVTV